MRRSLVVSLLGIVALSVGAFVAVLVAGQRPVLGLDLRGGVSVVLQPDAKRKVDSSQLDQAISIIRNRVDALGVAEPDISRQGNSIVISLPGVKDPDRALSIVGQTAELRFRPVISDLPAESTPSTTSTTAPQGTTTTAAGPTTTSPATTSTTVSAAAVPTTPRDQDDPKNQVVLPQKDKSGRVSQRYLLGPAEVFGSVVKSARADAPQAGGDWQVTVDFTNDGGSKFKSLAQANVNKRVAIVLDGVVESAPTIQPNLLTNFNNSAQITGQFSQKEAKDLSTVLRFGSLPVQLTPQSTQTVSATLGKNSLKAGVVAGIVGLGLVLLYMIAYYRALGIVVVLGLAVSGMLLWAIVSFLGSSSGLALSLAGATGIIVSVGVTVDSYVVYFERLKDEIRSGKTVRSSVDRGFARAYRTILAADLVSFIAAALLYWLTVGPVRGFAFYLGLSTILDVITAYVFTRPMVILLGRNRLFTEARFLGVARGLAANPAGGAA